MAMTMATGIQQQQLFFAIVPYWKILTLALLLKDCIGLQVEALYLSQRTPHHRLVHVHSPHRRSNPHCADVSVSRSVALSLSNYNNNEWYGSNDNYGLPPGDNGYSEIQQQDQQGNNFQSNSYDRSQNYGNPQEQQNWNSYEYEEYSGQNNYDIQQQQQGYGGGGTQQRPRGGYNSFGSMIDFMEETDRMFDAMDMMMMSPFGRRPNRRRGSPMGRIFDDFDPFFSGMPFLLSPFSSGGMRRFTYGSDLQQQQLSQPVSIRSLLDTAERYLSEDVACTTALGGDPIVLGIVYSQSSSFSSVNGGPPVSRTTVSVGVQGQQKSGIVQLVASNDRIEQLVLEVDRRQINVRLPRDGHRGRYGSTNTDEIFDAEVIEDSDNNQLPWDNSYNENNENQLPWWQPWKQ